MKDAIRFAARHENVAGVTGDNLLLSGYLGTALLCCDELLCLPQADTNSIIEEIRY